ncbi:MAG TPA: hypothetical protein VFI90_08095 [Rubrobacter sp.]|nr:hypothetical protein [Rubrobacter sp.]
MTIGALGLSVGCAGGSQQQATGNESTSQGQQEAEDMNALLQASCAGGNGSQRQESRSDTHAEIAYSMNYDIWTMNIDGSDAKPLTDTREFEESGPALSPDGKWIAFTRKSYETASSASPEPLPKIYVMKADGSCQTKSFRQ